MSNTVRLTLNGSIRRIQTEKYKFLHQAFGLISLEYYALNDSHRIVRHLSNLIHHTNLTKEHLKYEISLTLRNMAKNLVDSDAIELINMAMAAGYHTHTNSFFN